jgi:hypothetical protein
MHGAKTSVDSQRTVNKSIQLDRGIDNTVWQNKSKYK